MHSFSMHSDDQHSCADVLPGTLQMLILKTLTRGPLHGYAIAQQIKLTSDDVLQVEEGSLYPALQRMLLKGWVTAEWVQAGPKRRARVYRLTAVGRKQLADEVSAFTRVTDATFRVIQPA
jgi:PadR family transcriptional regulator, regulatory protein PadR